MFAVIISLLLGWVMWYILTTYTRLRKMPPGPFPLPLIGNVHQVGSDPPFSMEKLREKYGEVYTLTFPIGTYVVVNSGALAREVLVTAKDDFASRPGASTFPSDDVFKGKNIVYSDFGPNYMFRRKIVTSALHTFGEGLNLAEARVNNEVQELLDRIERTDGRPFCVREQLAATMINVIAEWLFSNRYDIDDPVFKLFSDLDDKMMVLFQQGSYYQVLPFLKYLPNNSIAKHLEDVLKIRDDFLLSELKEHRATYQEGIVRDITDALLASFDKEKAKNPDKDIGTYEDIKYLIIDIIIGATGTVTSTLSWLIVFMILHEDIQSEVQQELDRVVGRGRLPCWKDVENLHYLSAVIAETMRRSVFMPFSPRRAIRDSTIQGYHIPKDTGILLNVWRIHFNPKDWEQPALFKPERFLDDDGKFVGWTSLPSFFPFGAGRRVCLGQTLGKMDTFAAASRLLHQFRFGAPAGEAKPTAEGETGLIRFPKNCRVSASLRV